MGALGFQRLKVVALAATLGWQAPAGAASRPSLELRPGEFRPGDLQ